MNPPKIEILLVGTGVIGTAFGVNLAAAGHSVHVYAHGERSEEISKFGLCATDLTTGKHFQESVQVVINPSMQQYDLVLVSVRQEQLSSTFPVVAALQGKPTVLFFGNNPVGHSAIPDTISGTIELGFPGIGGSISEGVVKYIRIPQQPTTIQVNASIPTQNFAQTLQSQGFKVTAVNDMDGWLLYHAIFVSCVAAALYQSGTDPLQLSRNHPLLKLMCTAITEGFAALKDKGIAGVPRNLSILHQPWLRPFAIFYWQWTFRSKMGELCFAAHARHAKMEMQELAHIALGTVAESKCPTKNLMNLLNGVSGKRSEGNLGVVIK